MGMRQIPPEVSSLAAKYLQITEDAFRGRLRSKGTNAVLADLKTMAQYCLPVEDDQERFSDPDFGYQPDRA